jgi:hypothetical protein
VIGLGGAGTYVCRRLQERIAANPMPAPAPNGGPGPHAAPRPASPPEILALDTDRSLAQALPERGLLLTTNAAVLDAAYRQPERFHAEWLNRDILRGRAFVEQGTAGGRMLGRFLLLLPENRNRVRERVQKWLQSRPQPEEGRRHRVYVVAGAAGGTGGGQVVDTAYIIQELAASLGADVELRAVLFVPPPAEGGPDPRAAANAFATLTELHYFSDPNTRYRAHLADGEAPFETRRAPYHRVALLTSVNKEGDPIPLQELQERAVIYLLTASVGDDGGWEAERAGREGQLQAIDLEGNPQVFSTFGTEWVEYPEERLVNAVYRNLVRRSLSSWLQGDEPATLAELPANVPLRDSDALARLLTNVGQDGAAAEAFLERIRTRLPWIHKAPPHQWGVMDQELEGLLVEAAGTAPAPGRPAKGPMADRFKKMREQVIGDLRGQAGRWLKKDNLSLERVSRVLNEAATELRTTTDPVAAWEEARDTIIEAKGRILWAVAAVRKDPYLTFWKRLATRRLAKDYEKLAALHVHHYLRAHTIPYLRDLRAQIMEPVRVWSGRIGELGGLFARLSRSMADYESALLERLRKDEEDKRLVLGLLRLPGAETPYIANTGWNLPYCRPEDERAAIGDLRHGWIERLVDREDGLLADPGRSVVDGPSDSHREDRLPWLMPASYTPSTEGGSARMRDAVMQIDGELRARIEDRLRTWLSATAFQRMAEQYRNPVDLEFQLRRLIGEAAELSAIEPPHVRPAGFPMEYEMIFFGEAKASEVPSVMKMVVDAAGRERPTRVVPSRSSHFLTAVAEHPGFTLARCPAYHHLEETFQEWSRIPENRGAMPFNRVDVPWNSATLVTRARLRDASDVFYLALALGVLPVNPDGMIPVPGTILPLESGEQRFPLPGEFDLAVRQLAGDLKILEALSQAVDRTVQSKGVEWCGLQLERAARGENPLPIRFPGAHPLQQARTARLVALRAAARYQELMEEYARTATGRDTEWLRAGTSHYCPACGQDLGADAEVIPGACPRCREPLLPHKLHGIALTDGFRRIPNPYVVGTPLETRSNVFVGREDIINTVHDRLIRPAQRTILILIGERRCGKTSALRQLKYRLEGDLTPLFIDMQGLTASDLPGFLWWLAWRMKEALDERGIQVELPTFEEFSSGPPDYQFETVILAEVRRKLSGGRVLLMLDEFEVLAQRVMNGTFDPRAFDYIRHLMQHGEGIEFLFAGTHVLRQFAANYVTFLFNIGVFINVDFLTQNDALRLIQEPVAQAGVTYEPGSTEAMLELTGSHAYFTQMFCFHLVERLNRLRKRDVTREDVEAESGPVIAAAGAHLDHVWGQLNGADRLLASFFVEFCPRGQQVYEDDLLQAAIRDDSALRPFVFRTAVEKLVAVGLLRAGTEERDGREARTLRLSAEVYRRWLQTAHAYSRLREEGVKWE